LLFAETPKSKIRSPAVGGFPQSDVLFYNCLLWAFAAAVSAAEWFFIAALSAAMKKISSSAFSAPRAKRAVMSYSRTYPHSKTGTISIAEGLRA
jgi:hypothetical protein